jgi:hypothetical protein
MAALLSPQLPAVEAASSLRYCRGRAVLGAWNYCSLTTGRLREMNDSAPHLYFIVLHCSRIVIVREDHKLNIGRSIVAYWLYAETVEPQRPRGMRNVRVADCIGALLGDNSVNAWIA